MIAVAQRRCSRPPRPALFGNPSRRSASACFATCHIRRVSRIGKVSHIWRLSRIRKVSHSRSVSRIGKVSHSRRVSRIRKVSRIGQRLGPLRDTPLPQPCAGGDEEGRGKGLPRSALSTSPRAQSNPTPRALSTYPTAAHTPPPPCGAEGAVDGGDGLIAKYGNDLRAPAPRGEVEAIVDHERLHHGAAHLPD